MKKINLLLLLLASIHVAQAETWDEMLPKIAQSKAQVIFLGDSHSSDFHKTALDQLLVGLNQNNPSVNCVLYELDPTWYQQALNDTLSGKEPYATLANRVFDSTPVEVQWDYGFKHFRDKVPSSFPEHLFKSLRDVHAKIVAIDKPKDAHYLEVMNNFPNLLMGEIPTPAQWDERNRMQMIERNQYMANQIVSLIQNGTCTRAIAFLGSDHLLEVGKLQLADERLTTVPEQVSEKLSTETIAIYFNQEEIEKQNKKIGPQVLIGGLEYLPLKNITYVPKISFW